MMSTLPTRAGGQRCAMRTRVAALVGLVLSPVLSLSLAASQAYAGGGGTDSITSPGVMAGVAEAGVSEAEWLAFLAGHAELGGASAAAPIASAVGTAGLAVAGGSVVSGDGMGGITALLGGIKNWVFGAPAAGVGSGLPPGPSGPSQWFGPSQVSTGSERAVTTVSGVTFATSGNTVVVTASKTVGYVHGVSCFAARADGTAVQSYQLSSIWTGGGGWTWTHATPLGGSTIVGIRCYATSSNNVYPTAPSPLNAVTVANWAPTNYNAYPILTYGTFPGAGGANPSRYIEQTVTCKRADGTTSTVTSSTTAAPMTAGEMVNVAGLMCPSGARAVGVVATVKTTGGSDLVVVNQPYAPGTGLDAVTGNIPEPCYSGTTCYLDLQTRTSTTPETWGNVDPADVPNWWTDPSRDLTYRCVYGTGASLVVLPITSCEVYKSPPELAKPTTPTGDPAPNPDPAADCSFGWLDLVTGGILVRGSKCVLLWAFTPSPGTVDTLYAQVQVRAPFSVGLAGLDGANAMVTAYNGAGSCGSIADFTSDDIDGLIKCDAFSKIPGAPALRALVGVVLVTLTALSVVNMATARFSGGAT